MTPLMDPRAVILLLLLEQLRLALLDLQHALERATSMLTHAKGDDRSRM